MKKSALFICEHCDRQFTEHKNLQTHIRTAKYCLKLRGELPMLCYTCEFCNASFTQKNRLTSHLKSCLEANLSKKDRDIKSLEEDIARLVNENSILLRKNKEITIKLKKSEIAKTRLNNDLQKKDNLYNKTLKEKEDEISQKTIRIANQKIKIIEQHDEIISLRERVSEKEGVTKGILIGIDKAKPIIQNTNNNTKNNTKYITNNVVKQKLDAIPIDNIEAFDIDLVYKTIDRYDYKTFMQGVLGIINYLKAISTLVMSDGTVEKNYACTNPSIGNFFRLVNDESADDNSTDDKLVNTKTWKEDKGTRYMREIFPILAEKASEHMGTLAEEIKGLDCRSDQKRYLVEEEAKLRDIEIGLRKEGSKEREELIRYVMNKIKISNKC